ncbi:DUF2341 domain-containing protein, partial [Candidatus Bathyarchaeota archaeon]|nr:DUF2341 domain-containing protein [Candidatus Bathyarchaeota archaeon]
GFGLRQSDEVYYKYIVRYNATSNSWSGVLANATYARAGVSCGVVNDRLYVMGGRDNFYDTYGLNYNEEFTLATYGDSRVATLKDVYFNSSCRTDFGDVRFTLSDGKTLLDYYIFAKVNSDYAIFWVKVSANLNTPQTIYVYYGNSTAPNLDGNSTAPNMSSFDNAFTLTDDFNQAKNVTVDSR